MDPDPSTGSPNRHYVPSPARSSVIYWAHTAKFTCHPGVQSTLSFLKRYFWWASMDNGIREYVSACSVCARNKRGNRSSAGLLQALAIPKRPWSHTSLDFVTELPPSQGHTTVLSIVDRFSKAACYVQALLLRCHWSESCFRRGSALDCSDYLDDLHLGAL